jgi:hypothetical protein
MPIFSSFWEYWNMNSRSPLACLGLAFAICICPPQKAYGQGLPETKSAEYPSVAAALAALRARKDLMFSENEGWLNFSDDKNLIKWAFTPKGHPAYPAMIKRAVVKQGNALNMVMTAQCEASKLACDTLVREFQAMNESAARQLQATTPPKPMPPGKESTIDVQALGDEGYKLTLKTFRSTEVAAGQLELLPKAKELCGAMRPEYGKYEFKSEERVDLASEEPGQLTLQQMLKCVDPATSTSPAVAENRDSSMRPTAEQDAAVERQTLAYFAARDAKKYQDAYAMFAESQKKTVAFDGWAERVDKFNTVAGAVISRTVRKITWYKDPPGTAPGVYAAADYSSKFANADFHCGYVAWRVGADGALELVREEENFIDNATMKRVKPEAVDQLLKQMRCRQ